MIQFNSPIPIYQQISNIIQERIDKYELKPGDRIGSISELMKEYSIGRVTAVSVIEDLVKRGYVISKQGKGTFVKDGQISETLLSLNSFKEISKHNSCYFEYLIIKYEEIHLNEYLKDIFDYGDTEGIYIQRLHLYKDKPVALYDIYLPKSIANITGMNEESIGKLSMFEFLENNGVKVDEAMQTINAINAYGEISKILKIEDGKALLLTERISYNKDKMAVMCSNLYYLGDTFNYTVKLKRNRNGSIEL